jgi:1-acyl-sn-glycerol-3-phosphate acyltransferase/glycine/D-amino acid oxidase-like deaminating enzyme
VIHCARKGSMHMKICIVGSGMAGLSAAHYLSDAPDHTVTVLEADPQFGGRANVTADGEHCTRLFLPDYQYLFGLFREIPAGTGSVLDSLRRCRRFAGRGDGTWVEIDHIYAFLARTPGLTLRDKRAIARSNRQAILVARQAGSLSTNVLASVWNWSAASLFRAVASSRRERTSYALAGSTNRHLIDPWVEFLRARGVVLRTGCRVDRVRPSSDGVTVAAGGTEQRFDVVVFAGFVHDAYGLLDRSGIARPLDPRRHTHCKAFTIDLDPAEKVLVGGDVRIYAGEGITTVVQPDESRCVTLAAFPVSTDDDFILDQVRRQLSLLHEPLRVRTRPNLDPAEAVFVGEYVDPVRLEKPTRGRVYFAGSYTDNSYPLDSAEGACRSAYAAVERLARDHGTRVRSNLGLPRPTRARRTTAAGGHANAVPHRRRAAAMWATAVGASAWLTPLVSRIVFDDASGCTWPLRRPAIYVANHRSLFDVPVGVLAFRRMRVTPRLVVAEKYFDRAFGKLLPAAGMLPAIRGSDATVNAAVSAVLAGDSVAIMPEGRILTQEDAMAAEYGSGAARIAIATGAAIVPIGACGTHRVWPRPRPWPLVRLNRPRVTVVFGTPVDPAGHTCESLTGHLRSVLRSLEARADGRPAADLPQPVSR